MGSEDWSSHGGLFIEGCFQIHMGYWERRKVKKWERPKGGEKFDVLRNFINAKKIIAKNTT